MRPYLRLEGLRINEYTVQRPMAQNAHIWGYLAARDPLASNG